MSGHCSPLDSLRLGAPPKSDPGRTPFPRHPWTRAGAHLEHRDNGPEQGVEVLPVRDGVSRVRAEAELAAKDVHSKDAGGETEEAQGTHTHSALCPPTLFHSQNHPLRWEGPVLVPFYRREHRAQRGSITSVKRI